MNCRYPAVTPPWCSMSSVLEKRGNPPLRRRSGSPPNPPSDLFIPAKTPQATLPLSREEIEQAVAHAAAEAYPVRSATTILLVLVPTVLFDTPQQFAVFVNSC